MRNIIAGAAASLMLAAPVTAASFSALTSWYGPGFHGRTTASGTVYDQWAFTAAHKTLPFGTRVRVTNPRTGESITVTITDRGPFIGAREFDLSRGAAEAVSLIHPGVAYLEFEIL
jgi:rare lipoprotein A